MKKLSLPLKKKVSNQTEVGSSKIMPDVKKADGETPGVTMSVYITNDIAGAVKRIAAKNDRKVSYIIKQALEEFIAKHDKGK